MRKHIMLVAGAVALALSTPAATAQDKKIENPWMQCGIGAMVFPEIPVGAAISNIIWDLGTTAISSAASSPDSCTGKNYEAAMFINRAYTQVAAETAVGSGEYLTAVADILGCSEASRPALVARIREDVATSMAQPGFADKARVEKAEAYFAVVNDIVTTEFAGQCTLA